MRNTEASSSDRIIEWRIARVARRAAKLVLALKRDGELAAAATLQRAAAEAVEAIRRGAQ